MYRVSNCSISLMPRFTGMRDGAGVGAGAGCAGGAGLNLALIASRWKYTPSMETISPTIPSTVTSERLLLSLAVAVVVLLAQAVVLLALAVVLLALAACACFLASHARRLRSANLLPEATRPGFLAGFVCGGSAVTRAGVGVGVGSSGIVSSGCEAIGYIYIYRVQISTKFLQSTC